MQVRTCINIDRSCNESLTKTTEFKTGGSERITVRKTVWCELRYNYNQAVKHYLSLINDAQSPIENVPV